MPLRLSPKRFVAIVSAVLACYSLARVGVLFFEAIAVVREQRNEDYELIEACQQGTARGSAKMRDACLKARAELASPVVFKAVTVAVATAFKDFTDTVGSPFKFCVLLLFVVSSVAMPIAPWARALFGQPAHEPFNGTHFISYTPPPYAHTHRRGIRSRVGSAMRRLKLRPGPSIVEPGSDDDLEPGEFTSTKHAHTLGQWATIDIGNRPVSPNHAKYE